jgi:uncharacterized protein (TIGR02246 family)
MSPLSDQVQATFDHSTAAWKANDGAALATSFTDDGSLINPFGQRADGRSAIAAMYAEYFGGMLRGSSTAFTLTSVRAVETTHAFADGEQTISGPDGTVILAVHLSALLRRDGDTWRWVDVRPYAFASPPG